MPELPEVETVISILKKLVIGKEIKNVDVLIHKIVKNMDVKTFEKSLKKQTIHDIHRKGKYILFILDNYVLVSHLRMEGKYFFKRNDPVITKHDHVIFTFKDNTSLMYNDTRMFGTMDLLLKEELDNFVPITKLGPEPNTKEFNVKYLMKKRKRKSICIKNFLLDQTIISGLGNIYVDETLFCAQIHPNTSVINITEEDFKKIISCANKTIKKAIKAGGSSVKSFSVSEEIDPKFQNQLNVYFKHNTPCKRCKTTIEKIKVSGRGTHFCPVCQELK